MPRATSKKVKIRAEEVARLLRTRGCITVGAVVGMGISRTQAEDALKYLASAGRAVRVPVGRISLWCYSRKSAVRHLRRLRNILHSLICAAKVKYVSPKKALTLVMSDKKARRLFSRYVRLDVRNATALSFFDGLLALMYGAPVVENSQRTIYFADCNKKPRPLPPFYTVQHKRQYTTLHFKVEPELRDALKKAAELEGVSVSAVVRRAIELLLERYRSAEIKISRQLVKALKATASATPSDIDKNKDAESKPQP